MIYHNLRTFTTVQQTLNKYHDTKGRAVNVQNTGPVIVKWLNPFSLDFSHSRALAPTCSLCALPLTLVIRSILDDEA